MMGGDRVTAGLVVIGDEILSGRTQDTNTHYLAGWLTDRGIALDEVRVVPDVHERIVEAVNALRARMTYVFTTGGIGPTHDDITADAIAAAMGVGIDFHEEAFARLQAHYPPGQFTAERQRMARVPHGASLIDNPVSTAPGFRIENVFVMAGVPVIMKSMLDSIAHELIGGPKMLSRALVIDMPESAFAGALGNINDAHPSVAIGSYPFYKEGRAGVQVVMRATDAEALEAAVDAVAAAARGAGANPEEKNAH